MNTQPIKPVVVNEHGSVDIYSSASTACSSLEAIDVRAGEYEAFDIHGRRLQIIAEGWVVKMEYSTDTKDYSAHVERLVRAFAHRIGPRKLPTVDPDTDSVENLARAILNLRK